MSEIKATILGSGSSGGVPRIGNNWGACDPNNPKNRRLRCSMLVEQGDVTALIDTSPDMREQLLTTGHDWVDGALFTHSHADQAHGIDDLRVCAINRMRRVDVYGDAETLSVLSARFDYCFEGKGGYPAILDSHTLVPGEAATVTSETGGEMQLLPFEVDHGGCPTLGFRVGGLAYTPDIVDVPDSAADTLSDLDVWVVDALRYTPHPTHAHVEKTLKWIARFKPKRAILTNLHVDLDYETLRAELPDGVEPAYDGMEILA